MKQYCTTSNIAPQTSIAARAYCTMKQYRTNIAPILHEGLVSAPAVV